MDLDLLLFPVNFPTDMLDCGGDDLLQQLSSDLGLLPEFMDVDSSSSATDDVRMYDQLISGHDQLGDAFAAAHVVNTDGENGFC
jgi:hypothetical protein